MLKSYQVGDGFLNKIKILVAYHLESMEMVITVTMGLMAALSLLKAVILIFVITKKVNIFNV